MNCSLCKHPITPEMWFSKPCQSCHMCEFCCGDSCLHTAVLTLPTGDKINLKYCVKPNEDPIDRLYAALEKAIDMAEIKVSI
jgi:hypothetical protein